MALSYSRSILRMTVSLLSVAVFLSIFACSEEKKTQAAPKALPVTAVKVVAHDVSVTRDFIGQTTAVKTVEIRSKVEGFLKQRLFVEGSMVKKGDPLFVIDPKPFQESLNQAVATLHREEAGLAKAELDYNRFKALLDKDAVSREEFDVKATALQELQATVEGYQAAVKNARLDLGYTNITAPMDGLIGKTDANIGTLVSKEQTLLATVSSMDPMYVNFSISERDYLLAMRNHYSGEEELSEPEKRDLDLILADGDIYEIKGKVDMIDPTVDPKTGTLGIRAVFENPRYILRPGQFAKIRAVIATLKDAVVVPSRALIDTQGLKSLLLVQDNGTVKNVPVTVQRVMNNIAVIKEGIKAGDVIISEGVRRIRPGSQVNATLQAFSGEVAGGAGMSANNATNSDADAPAPSQN